MTTSFPSDFKWGLATSAYQIEGATSDDGRQPSIWDTLDGTPGAISDGSRGTTACDHYHRWSTDVDILAGLGVNAYRFSVAWPRVVPAGAGTMNEAGLAFYDRLVDGLLARGVEPVATLYHWDLPQALDDAGGWASRTTAERFAEYATHVGRRLGDRVKTWVTINEPWCAAVLGHEKGEHAPGRRDRTEALAAAHHLLLAHGLGAQALEAVVDDPQIGLSHVVTPGYAASSSEADLKALDEYDGSVHRWFIEPPALGRYPADVVERYLQEGLIDDAHPALAHPDDLRIMGHPHAFFGMNYYTRAVIRADVPEEDNLPRAIPDATAEARTDMGWEIFPEGLYAALDRATREWQAPQIFVTEFGAAFADGPDDDGRVRDERRVRYLREHLEQARRALADGLPLGGLFAWSLLDNFEWAFGYTKRFGLVHVDYETQERTIKDSGLWYRDYIAEARKEVFP